MSRLDALIEEHCPGGVERKALGEVGTFVRGSGLQKKDFVDKGIGCIHYGQVYTHYGISATQPISFVTPEFASNKRKVLPGDVFIATTSENDEDLGKAVAWLGDNAIVASGDAYIYKHSLDAKYVAYFLNSINFQQQKQKWITGTKVRRIAGSALERIVIPVPPLPVQQEIVRILDMFTHLEAELEAELEARKQQYSYYRQELLRFSNDDRIEWSTLGGVSLRVSSGGTPTKSVLRFYENGHIPWLRTQEVKFSDVWQTNEFITEEAVAETSASWIPENCLIVAISGASAGRSAINKIPLTTNQHCCNIQIDPDVMNYRFAFYWVSSKYEELKSLGRGARSDLNAAIIKSFPIPVPSLEEQNRVVELLDKFDALVNDLSAGLPAEISARRQQYEYYRDKLLTFKEL